MHGHFIMSVVGKRVSSIHGMILGISPEQLIYLQLLQNPLAALGLGGAIQPQVSLGLS